MLIRPFATALRNLLLISRMICIMTIHLADATPLLPVCLLSLHHLHLLSNPGLLLFCTWPGKCSVSFFNSSIHWWMSGLSQRSRSQMCLPRLLSSSNTKLIPLSKWWCGCKMASVAQNWQDPEPKSISCEATCEAYAGFSFTHS